MYLYTAQWATFPHSLSTSPWGDLLAIRGSGLPFDAVFLTPPRVSTVNTMSTHLAIAAWRTDWSTPDQWITSHNSLHKCIQCYPTRQTFCNQRTLLMRSKPRPPEISSELSIESMRSSTPIRSELLPVCHMHNATQHIMLTEDYKYTLVRKYTD